MIWSCAGFVRWRSGREDQNIQLCPEKRNNTQKDFEFSYFGDIDDALIEGLSQNQDFFTLFLNNDETKREVPGIFSDEIYKSLQEWVATTDRLFISQPR